ncbi:MAG: GldG family protein [Candidatus Omnitrophica bacterium]|nr:GldG family protein [Candidatus Omnitrophota bacterium]
MVEKKFFYRINAVLMVLIFLGILVFVNLISNKYYRRIDLTKNKIHSISPQTKKIIKNLNQPVEIIAFYREKPSEKAKDIFEQYKLNSKLINYRFVDLDRDIMLAKQYGITSYDTVIIKIGENYEKIYSFEEKDITSAILKLTQKEKKKICFSIGHGEKTLEGELNLLKQYIEEENYEVRETLILRDGIPEDCGVFVICGPKIDIQEKEFEEIKNFLNKGGKILLFLEPGNYINIAKLLDSYGVKIENDIIVDLASRRFLGDALSPLIMDYPYHDITKDFNLACVFSTVRSVKLKDELPYEIKGTILAKTSSASWAEKDIKEVERGNVKFDENDERGPVSIAVIVEKDVKEGEEKIGSVKIAVFGDSDFISNKFINLSGNKDFALNTINYLCEEDVLVSIRSKKEENQPLILSQKSGKFLFFMPVVIIPVLIIITGGYITIKRKIFY